MDEFACATADFGEARLRRKMVMWEQQFINSQYRHVVVPVFGIQQQPLDGSVNPLALLRWYSHETKIWRWETFQRQQYSRQYPENLIEKVISRISDGKTVVGFFRSSNNLIGKFTHRTAHFRLWRTRLAEKPQLNYCQPHLQFKITIKSLKYYDNYKIRSIQG